MVYKPVDLTGQMFGSLKAIERYIDNSWRVQCVRCGKNFRKASRALLRDVRQRCLNCAGVDRELRGEQANEGT